MAKTITSKLANVVQVDRKKLMSTFRSQLNQDSDIGSSCKDFIEWYLKNALNNLATDIIVEGTYTSVWNDGLVVNSNCKVNLTTGDFFDVFDNDFDENNGQLEILEREFITVDGVHYEIEDNDKKEKAAEKLKSQIIITKFIEKDFKKYDVPNNIKKATIEICTNFCITSDPIGVSNLIAIVSKVGDGNGNFTSNKISNCQKIATRLISSYNENIPKKMKRELVEILSKYE